MNPSSSGHRGVGDIAYRVLVRSGYGVDSVKKSAVAAERPPVPVRTVIEDVAADAVVLEDDDTFQWFVNLFVAEYASEAKPGPNVPV